MTSLTTKSAPSSRLPRASKPLLVAGAFAVVSMVTAFASKTASAASACPSDMAHVGTSCVDKYEGSLVEVLANGQEVDWSPYQNPNGHNVRAVSREGVVPQAHISMFEAKAACKASGKRLCHAGEWKAACRGPEKTRYPYGDVRQANVCTDTSRTSPLVTLHGGAHTPETMNDAALNQEPNTLARSGEAAECTNGYGVHDMVGNIHEWTDDAGFRGGYYLDTKLNGEGCDYVTTAHAPNYFDYSTGFRCCADEGALEDAEVAPVPTASSDSAAAPVEAPAKVASSTFVPTHTVVSATFVFVPGLPFMLGAANRRRVDVVRGTSA